MSIYEMAALDCRAPHNHRLYLMAEALAGLGVAASVIAVVQLTEDVIGKCSAYGTAYRNASRDMSRLSDQITAGRVPPENQYNWRLENQFIRNC
ncbi:hypothetical protein JB92DRAFT_2891094 [Gautieria morchelliformis]|nr:hypothetical protein JB92DRAFT_2891094 [Gautieria morchelliformis]